MSKILEIKELIYQLGKRTLFSGLNLALNQGEIAVLTGENGVGKSTLAELIIGIRHASSGKIIFKNRDITDLNIPDRANLGIGYAFQSPVSLRGLKVKDLVPDKNYLTRVGLPEEYLDRELNSSLSGGEKKRIELASVLARRPQLMILDEPEAGIDLWSLENLKNLFLDLKPKTSLLLISHQEKFINLADQKYILKDGKLCNL